MNTGTCIWCENLFKGLLSFQSISKKHHEIHTKIKVNKIKVAACVLYVES